MHDDVALAVQFTQPLRQIVQRDEMAADLAICASCGSRTSSTKTASPASRRFLTDLSNAI